LIKYLVPKLALEEERMDLIQDIFKPVVVRIRSKSESLTKSKIKRFPKTGIEGWFKVEVVAALGEKVIKLQNRGPDLILENGLEKQLEIELKAATDLNPQYIRNGALNYSCLCLFIGDGDDTVSLEKLRQDPSIKIVDSDLFFDGETNWIVGIIKPSLITDN
jgi:hypothetical protein